VNDQKPAENTPKKPKHDPPCDDWCVICLEKHAETRRIEYEYSKKR